MVLEATGNRFGVSIGLTKRIPVRAGLGGGSSDAAAALHAVNALAGNAVPRHELLHFAAKLGADVAFFASGAPLAVAWGRGERLFRIPAPPAMPAALAVPAISVATPDAYKWWDDQNPSPSARGPVARQLFEEAQEWLESRDRSVLFSFESICDTLEISPEFVRRRLREWEEHQGRLPRSSRRAVAEPGRRTADGLSARGPVRARSRASSPVGPRAAPACRDRSA